MNILLTSVCIVSVSFPIALDAHQHQPTQKAPIIAPLPRDLEVQVAPSALPPHLRDTATVCVLNPATGFEVA